jgi:GNAT superfamily N-acetyltransferase
MPIPSKPITLTRFRWKLADATLATEELPHPYVLRAADKPELEEALRVVKASYNLDHEWSGCGKHIEEVVLPGVIKAFEDEAYGLFVQHGNRVIAASIYQPQPEDGIHLVTGPCVLIEYRNRGIGGALLAATLQALKAHGVNEAVGQTRPLTPSAKFLCIKFGGEALPTLQTKNVPAIAAA